MATKFHINPVTGSVGACSAQPGNCPFGGADEHYPTPEAARAGFEAYMDSHTLPEPSVQEQMREDLIRNAEADFQKKPGLPQKLHELAKVKRRELQETLAYWSSVDHPAHTQASEEVGALLNEIDWQNASSIGGSMQNLAELVSEFENRGAISMAEGWSPWHDLAGQLEIQLEGTSEFLRSP